MSTTYTPRPVRKATKAAGAEWAAEAKAAGFSISTRDYGGGACVVEVITFFTAGDVAAYGRAEADASAILAGLPITRPGTTWGTTSDSVGGHSGLTAGHMLLCKSGVSKRFAQGIAAR